jgi:hypothetical protein
MMNFPHVSWIQIEAWAKTKLDQERFKNDDAAMDAVQTAFIRGRIALLKELLALPTNQDKATRARMTGPE